MKVKKNSKSVLTPSKESFIPIFIWPHYNSFSWYARCSHHQQPHHYIHTILYSKKIKIINLTYMISILNSIFTVVFYAMRWIKLDPTCTCFAKKINQLNLLYIYMFLYLQPDKSYESHELMCHIIVCNHSLGQNDTLKFIYYSMILFLIYL
jgi:hypothetical protein